MFSSNSFLIFSRRIARCSALLRFPSYLFGSFCAKYSRNSSAVVNRGWLALPLLDATLSNLRYSTFRSVDGFFGSRDFIGFETKEESVGSTKNWPIT